MTRRLLPFLILGLLLAAPSMAQERGAIAGKVFDKKTGHALPFATISVVGAHAGGLTDSEGQYRITVPAGTYEVKCQFLGYKPEDRAAVVVTTGRTTTLNFDLADIVVRE